MRRAMVNAVSALDMPAAIKPRKGKGDDQGLADAQNSSVVT